MKIVYVKGNADRAGHKEHNMGVKLKQFNKTIESLLKHYGTTKSVSSRNFKEVPDADLYVSHSRGCSRAKYFGSKDAKHICIDNFQKTTRTGNSLAGDPRHYELKPQELQKFIKAIKGATNGN